MAMQAPANAPLVCHGHSRPINHLEYSNVTEDGVFLISSSKGANPPLGLSRGSTPETHPAAREDTAGRRASIGARRGRRDGFAFLRAFGDGSIFSLISRRAFVTPSSLLAHRRPPLFVVRHRAPSVVVRRRPTHDPQRRDG